MASTEDGGRGPFRPPPTGIPVGLVGWEPSLWLPPSRPQPRLPASFEAARDGTPPLPSCPRLDILLAQWTSPPQRDNQFGGFSHLPTLGRSEVATLTCHPPGPRTLSCPACVCEGSFLHWLQGILPHQRLLRLLGGPSLSEAPAFPHQGSGFKCRVPCPATERRAGSPAQPPPRNKKGCNRHGASLLARLLVLGWGWWGLSWAKRVLGHILASGIVSWTKVGFILCLKRPAMQLLEGVQQSAQGGLEQEGRNHGPPPGQATPSA